MYGRETIDFSRAQVWLLGSKTTECLKHFGKFNRNLGGIFRGPLWDEEGVEILLQSKTCKYCAKILKFVSYVQTHI